jgi:hypothetical protein
MKFLSKIILSAVCLATFLMACDKADVVQSYKSGTAPVLSSSANTVAVPASDSDNLAVKFTWTYPVYATDSSTVKYILQIDSTTGFSNPVSFTVSGALSDTLSGRQINNLLLNTYGLKIGVPYNFNARIISSYANNNDQKISNTIPLSLTAYKIPPKVTPPAAGQLFIIGDATASANYNQPVAVPSQQFDQIDSVTYGGVFYLNAGGHYDFLPVNGSWSQKYTVPDNSLSGLSGGGSFQFYDVGVGGGQDMPAPATSGWYVIIVDFQAGKFTVTPFNTSGDAFTGDLFIIGDATSWGWNQPVPTPSQQFTQVNSALYTLTIPLVAGGGYLLLPTNGSYNKFAVNDNTVPWSGGSFGSELGQNFPAPPTSGTYTITVNLATLMFSVKQ